jgi:hypothetical protein
LVDELAEHDEPVTVFCAHDADGAGGLIYQTFQEATKARGARKIKIVNLGLEPWEAIEMGLARIMHHMPRFCMPGPHAYCTRTPSIRPVWIGVRQLAVQRVWV